MSSISPQTRRAFVGSTMVAGAAVAAVALAACGDGSSAAPNNVPSAPPEPSGAGAVVATLSELGVGTRLSVTAPRTGADGKTKDAGFLLFRPNEKTVLAYTAICTHQGCAVTTKAPQGEDFYCPCHGSYFQPSDGKAIAGPARGALERIAAQIKGQDVLIFV